MNKIIKYGLFLSATGVLSISLLQADKLEDGKATSNGSTTIKKKTYRGKGNNNIKPNASASSSGSNQRIVPRSENEPAHHQDDPNSVVFTDQDKNVEASKTQSENKNSSGFPLEVDPQSTVPPELDPKALSAEEAKRIKDYYENSSKNQSSPLNLIKALH